MILTKNSIHRITEIEEAPIFMILRNNSMHRITKIEKALLLYDTSTTNKIRIAVKDGSPLWGDFDI